MGQARAKQSNEKISIFGIWIWPPSPTTTGCKYYEIQLAKELVQPIQKGMLVPNFKKSTKSVDVKNADTVCEYSLEKSLKTCSEHPTRLGAYFMVRPF